MLAVALIRGAHGDEPMPAPDSITLPAVDVSQAAPGVLSQLQALQRDIEALKKAEAAREGSNAESKTTRDAQSKDQEMDDKPCCVT